jgi:hypothetical protein
MVYIHLLEDLLTRQSKKKKEQKERRDPKSPLPLMDCLQELNAKHKKVVLPPCHFFSAELSYIGAVGFCICFFYLL